MRHHDGGAGAAGHALVGRGRGDQVDAAVAPALALAAQVEVGGIELRVVDRGPVARRVVGLVGVDGDADARAALTRGTHVDAEPDVHQVVVRRPELAAGRGDDGDVSRAERLAAGRRAGGRRGKGVPGDVGREGRGQDEEGDEESRDVAPGQDRPTAGHEEECESPWDLSSARAEEGENGARRLTENPFCARKPKRDAGADVNGKSPTPLAASMNGRRRGAVNG